MNCERVRDLLSEAIDGTLAPAESAAFHAHLGDCGPCRLQFGELKESLALLAELPRVEPSEGFDDAVWTLIRAERRARDGGLRQRVGRVLEEWGTVGAWLRFAPLGAAAALLTWIAVSPTTPARIAAGTDRTGQTADAGDEFVVTGPTESIDPRFTPVEFPAGPPAPVSDLLAGSEGRDLALPVERYRRTTWHYPITPVADPANVVPVSGAPVNDFEAGSRVQETSPGAPVLSF